MTPLMLAGSYLMRANLRQVGTVTRSRGMLNRMFNTAYSQPIQCFRTTGSLSGPATLLGLMWLRGRFISWVPVTSADNGEKKEASLWSIIRSRLFWFFGSSDIILESVLIRSGPPAVYQLSAKRKSEKENEGGLSPTRMTVGEKNPNTINKTILLVGETGAGKSTVINALVNYTIGVTWEDEVWFKIVDEEERSQTESQTLDVIVYEIFDFEGKTLPYSLTIIDTPGFGDTKGIEYDDIISQRLLKLFESDDGVHEVNVVALVMKASDNRLNDRLKYTYDSVMSLFSKDLEKNIVALMTHSTRKKPQNALEALEVAKIKCAKNENGQPVYFLFDNCQDQVRKEEDEYLKDAHEFSDKGMREFTEFLGKTAPQKVKKTIKVLKKRIKLKNCIQNLQERIQEIGLKKREINQIRKGVEKNQSIVEVDEPYKVKEPIDHGQEAIFFYNAATSCKKCEETCHYPCTVAWYPENCEVMKRGRCIVCTKKCPASDHVKEKWRYVAKTRKVQKTLGEIKQKYGNTTESENNAHTLNNLGNEMKQLTALKSKLLDESYQHVEELEKIALKADSASTIVHLDFLIEKMKEKGDTEKVQKLQEMRSRVGNKEQE